jgi:hypothetical protein
VIKLGRTEYTYMHALTPTHPPPTPTPSVFDKARTCRHAQHREEESGGLRKGHKGHKRASSHTGMAKSKSVQLVRAAAQTQHNQQQHII